MSCTVCGKEVTDNGRSCGRADCPYKKKSSPDIDIIENGSEEEPEPVPDEEIDLD